MGAIYAAFIAGFFAFMGLVMSKENKTSEFRQKWIDDLRQELGDFAAAARELNHAREHVKIPDDANFESIIQHHTMMQPTYDRSTSAFQRIQMRINPDDKNPEMKILNGRLLSKIEEIRGFVNEDKFKEAKDAIGSLHTVAAPVLKAEWERVKEGEPIFRFSKYGAAAVVILVVGIYLASKFGVLVAK